MLRTTSLPEGTAVSLIVFFDLVLRALLIVLRVRTVTIERRSAQCVRSFVALSFEQSSVCCINGSSLC